MGAELEVGGADGERRAGAGHVAEGAQGRPEEIIHFWLAGEREHDIGTELEAKRSEKLGAKYDKTSEPNDVNQTGLKRTKPSQIK